MRPKFYILTFYNGEPLLGNPKATKANQLAVAQKAWETGKVWKTGLDEPQFLVDVDRRGTVRIEKFKPIQVLRPLVKPLTGA